jgi:hypothetical protein
MAKKVRQMSLTKKDLNHLKHNYLFTFDFGTYSILIKSIVDRIEGDATRIQELEKLIAQGCDIVEKDIERIAQAKREAYETGVQHEQLRREEAEIELSNRSYRKGKTEAYLDAVKIIRKLISCEGKGEHSRLIIMEEAEEWIAEKLREKAGE